jgi:hypothetical protein
VPGIGASRDRRRQARWKAGSAGPDFECGNSHKEGLDLCLLELKAERSRYTRITYAQDYGNCRFSNPTVDPDGKLVAFQFGYASDEPGVGRGIFLMEFPPVSK